MKLMFSSRSLPRSLRSKRPPILSPTPQMCHSYPKTQPHDALTLPKCQPLRRPKFLCCIHMTEHSPSLCLLTALRETLVLGIFPPPFFKSSSLSLAFGKFWATPVSQQSNSLYIRAFSLNSPAARQYHLLASSRLAGVPIPASVK